MATGPQMPNTTPRGKRSLSINRGRRLVARSGRSGPGRAVATGMSSGGVAQPTSWNPIRRPRRKTSRSRTWDSPEVLWTPFAMMRTSPMRRRSWTANFRALFREPGHRQRQAMREITSEKTQRQDQAAQAVVRAEPPGRRDPGKSHAPARRGRGGPRQLRGRRGSERSDPDDAAHIRVGRRADRADQELQSLPRRSGDPHLSRSTKHRKISRSTVRAWTRYRVRHRLLYGQHGKRPRLWVGALTRRTISRAVIAWPFLEANAV
jgi:hypothetical protein